MKFMKVPKQAKFRQSNTAVSRRSQWRAHWGVQWRTQWRGALLILLSAVLFSVMSLGIRTGREHFDASAMAFYRSLVQVVFLLPWILDYVDRRVLKQFRFHLYRGLFGIGSMVASYSAMQRLPLAFATLLYMTGAVWATIFARLFLREKLSNLQIAGFGVAVLGLLLVVLETDRSPTWSRDLLGIGLGLLGGVAMGAAHTFIRTLRVREISTGEIVFYFGLSGVLLNLPSMLLHPQLPTTRWDYGNLLTVGISGSIAQLFMTAGFRYAPTALGSLCVLAQTPLCVLLGMLWLAEFPPLGFYLGMALTFTGIAVVLYFSESPLKT